MERSDEAQGAAPHVRRKPSERSSRPASEDKDMERSDEAQGAARPAFEG